MTPNPVQAGQSVSESAVVTNDGSTALNSLSVISQLGGALTCPSSTLASGSSETCTKTFNAPSNEGNYPNDVVASALNTMSQSITGESRDSLIISAVVAVPDIPFGSFGMFIAALLAIASYGFIRYVGKRKS